MSKRLVCLVVLVSACVAGDRPPGSPAPDRAVAPAAAAAAAPLFTRTESAPSGSALRVFVEPRRITGWIAGSTSFAGTTATLDVDGRRVDVKVGADNTFVIAVDVVAPIAAKVSVGAMVQHVTLEPPAKPEPTALVIVDRNAYRPGQKLQFAGFLRRPDGESWRPLPHEVVEAKLIAKTRGTLAAKLSLVSDATGRIAGEYTFSTADALDDYELAITGYRGNARLTLGELRKPKVKLDVDAVVGGRDATLTFRALDFLDQPVPGGTVELRAQVVRDEPGVPGAGLQPNQRLAFLADPDSARIAATWREVVFEDTAKLELATIKQRVLPLREDWLRGRHSLLVDAVIVDANGREQRTTRAIPLARRDATIAIDTAHELAAAGEPIELAVRVTDPSGQPMAAAASVIAVRQTPPAPAYLGWNGGWNGGYYNNAYSNHAGSGLYIGGSPFSSWRACTYTAMGCRSWSRRTKPVVASAPEPIAAVTIVDAGRAALRLDEPGAYRLIAVAKLADGSSVWSERSVAVREADELPELVLELDRSELRHGDRLTGTLHARYRDARAFVIVRDAHGIESRSVLELAGGRARIDLPVGNSVGHGATVEAYILGGGGAIRAAQQLVRVEQTSRTLAIRTRAKDTYGPGDVVELDIDTGVTEHADLVISVFDQSLRSVARDHAIDPKSFYFVDPSIHSRAGLFALRTELGDLTVGDVVTRARAITKAPRNDDPQLGYDPKWHQASTLVNAIEQGRVDIGTLGTLLRIGGIDAAMVGWSQWSLPLDAKQRKRLLSRRVIDVLETDAKALAFERVADTTVIFDAATAGPGTAAIAWNPSYLSGNSVHSFAAPATAAPSPLDVGNRDGDVVRRDFSDSAFFDGRLRTGPDGKARVRFKLPDSLTNWQVVVTGIAGDLRVGRHETQLRTVRDVMVWPMIPRQFTEGDTVSVFASVHNLTSVDRDIVVALEGEHVELLSPARVTVRVPRGKQVPVTWSVRAGKPGFASMLMSASAIGVDARDASLKRIPIVASAADQVVTASGFATKPLVVELPAGVDPATARLEVTFAPSLAADMASTLDYLVEYPYGCAEQTMSRFVPAIRVAGILENLGIKDGALAAKLPMVVETGLKNLARLQQPDGGWGWQGGSTTHEMITPYVLWGLIEAERAGHRMTDERVIQRGMARVRQFLDNLGPEQLADRAFLLYVYSQREHVPAAWWRELVAKRADMSDYTLALTLEMADARGDHETARAVVGELRRRAHRTGGWVRWRTAGFSRWGDDPFEVTAAVLKALVRHDADDPMIADVISYLVAHKRGDRWNSTKDTAMILFAITEYLGKRGVGSTTGSAFVEYAIGERPSARVTFGDGLVRTVVAAGPLAHRTTITFPSASPGMMARAVLRYRESGRKLAPAAQGLEVMRTLYLLGDKGARKRELRSGDRVPRGAYVESVVTVTSTMNEPMRFMLVEDPKPAGAEALAIDDARFPAPSTLAAPRHVLREDREAKLAFHHEDAGESTSVRTVLHLEMAGELALPPAQAELMYRTQIRGHSGSMILRVGD